MLHPRLFEHFGPVGRIAIPLAASLATLTSPASAQVPLAPLPDDTSAVAESAAERMLLTTVSDPVVADSHALDVLGKGKSPAILLGMNALSLFDRVEIDFRRRKVMFVMPEGSERRKIRRQPTRMGTERI